MSKNYVKKHKGHKVPAGAAHYNIDNHCFYNKDKTKFQTSAFLGSEWTQVFNKGLASAAIELPEQDEVFEIIHAEQDLPNWDEQDDSNAAWIEDKEPDKICDLSGWYELFGEYYRNLSDSCKIEKGSDMITVHKRPIAIEDKEWLPEVGEECEALDTLMAHPRYCFAKIKGFYNKQVWLTSEAGVELVLFINDLKFRPLKTAEEKEEEYNLCYLRGLQPTVHGTSADKIQGYLNDYTDMLVKAGITAPKGEK